MLTVYLPCQLRKAGKGRAYLQRDFFNDHWIIVGLIESPSNWIMGGGLDVRLRHKVSGLFQVVSG